jgi:hypothetical protein
MDKTLESRLVFDFLRLGLNGAITTAPRLTTPNDRETIEYRWTAKQFFEATT